MELPGSFTALLKELAGGENKTKLGVALGKTFWQVNYWWNSNVIPEGHWDDIIKLAAERGMPGVTKDYLRRLKKEAKQAAEKA